MNFCYEWISWICLRFTQIFVVFRFCSYGRWCNKVINIKLMYFRLSINSQDASFFISVEGSRNIECIEITCNNYILFKYWCSFFFSALNFSVGGIAFFPSLPTSLLWWVCIYRILLHLKLHNLSKVLLRISRNVFIM